MEGLYIILLFLIIPIAIIIRTTLANKKRIEKMRRDISEFEERFLKGNDFKISKRVVLIDEFDKFDKSAPKNGQTYNAAYGINNSTGIWFDYENRKVAVLSEILLNNKSEVIFGFDELASLEIDGETIIKAIGNTAVECMKNWTLRIVINKDYGTKSTEIRFNSNAELKKGSILYSMVENCINSAKDELNKILSEQKR